ncbi:Lysophospholipase D gdpd1 [Mactra antiquata]
MDLVYIIVMAVLATLFGGYLAASIIFLRFPHLLHKKKKLKFRPVHISHRGGAGENCENTITAFKHALSQGTQMLEIDCHLTKDGEVVVAHDSHLLKKCNKDVKIPELDLKDLPEYCTALSLDFQPDFTLHVDSDDRKIPTLRQVFTAFPTTPMNIDVKVYDDQLFQKVNGLIQEFNREDLTIWGGRLSTTTRTLHELNSVVPVFFSFRRVFTLILLFYSGLLPFVPLYESALEIIMPSIALSKKKNVELSLKYRLLLRLADLLLMRPALFKHLDRRGIQTYLWVLNEEEHWERAFKLGATGVMTDFPSRLTHFLRSHPELVDNWKLIENTEEDRLIGSKQPE